jgi:hypothetical protein
MLQAPPPEALFLLASGWMLGAVAAALVALDRSRRVLLFAGFLLLEGLANISLAYSTGSSAAWGRNAAFHVVALFLLAQFGLEYRRAASPGRRPGVPWLPAVGVAVAALGLAMPWLMCTGCTFDPSVEGLRPGPMMVFLYLLLVLQLLLGWVLAGDALGLSPGPRRQSHLLVAFGLLAEPLFALPAEAVDVPVYLLRGPAEVVWPLALTIPVAGIAVLGAARVLPSLWNAPSLDPSFRTAGRRFTLGIVGVAASGAAIPVIEAAAGYAVSYQADVLLTGVWVAALALLPAYALLRHRLFDIDLRLKVAVRRTTLAGALLALYAAFAQLAQGAFPSAWAPLVLVASAVSFVVVLGPLQAVADRIATAAFPQANPEPSYLSARKLEVYRAALEESHGHPGAQEQLARLRSKLGLTERDHAVLLHAVQRGAPRGAAWVRGSVVLGRYRIEGDAGEGAHGHAFVARDLRSRARVVVKLLRPQRAGDPGLVREARAVAAVRHPNVVAITEVGEAGGQPAVVMEYVEGGSLRDRLARGALARGEFARLADGLLAALEAVHAAGIVHRDVKPSNILLTREGGAKLSDFGVARLPGAETTLGGEGAAIGTVRYMSPEVAKGKPATLRSDLFSAGTTLFEAYTGKAYLEAEPNESAVELQMRAARAGPFDKPLEPPGLRAWFARALEPDPALRFASARAMREALDAALA